MSTDETQTADRRWVLTHAGTLAWTLFVGVATVLLVLGTDDPRMRHTNVLNSLFDTRWMIGGGRVLAVTVFAWAMVSIGVRVSRGQWIRTFGPVSSEVQEGAEQLLSSQQELEARLEAADDQIAELQQQLREADRRTGPTDTMDQSADARRGGDPA